MFTTIAIMAFPTPRSFGGSGHSIIVAKSEQFHALLLATIFCCIFSLHGGTPVVTKIYLLPIGILGYDYFKTKLFSHVQLGTFYKNLGSMLI